MRLPSKTAQNEIKFHLKNRKVNKKVKTEAKRFGIVDIWDKTTKR